MLDIRPRARSAESFPPPGVKIAMKVFAGTDSHSEVTLIDDDPRLLPRPRLSLVLVGPPGEDETRSLLARELELVGEEPSFSSSGGGTGGGSSSWGERTTAE